MENYDWCCGRKTSRRARSDVHTVVHSPDGRHILSGSTDKSEVLIQVLKLANLLRGTLPLCGLLLALEIAGTSSPDLEQDHSHMEHWDYH